MTDPTYRSCWLCGFDKLANVPDTEQRPLCYPCSHNPKSRKAEYLWRWREAYDIRTKTKAAKLLGIPARLYGRYEWGKTEAPDDIIDATRELARAILSSDRQ